MEFSFAKVPHPFTRLRLVDVRAISPSRKLHSVLAWLDMNDVLRALLLSALLVGCSKKTETDFPSLDAWQGSARLEVETDGKPGTMLLAKRGSVVRFEAPDHPEVFGSYGGLEGPRHYLFDAEARTLTLVVDEPKQALDIDVSVLDRAATRPSGDAALKKSGRTDSVVGHTCEVWTYSDDTRDVEACIVQQKASALILGVGFLPQDAGWAWLLLDGEHVPLSVRVKEKGGAVLFAAKLTAFDQKPAEGPFEVPVDYQRDNLVRVLKRLQEQRNAQ